MFDFSSLSRRKMPAFYLVNYFIPKALRISLFRQQRSPFTFTHTMQQQEMLHHACPRCGQPMSYSGGKFKLQCNNCGYNRALGRESDQVDNHPLKAGVSLKAFDRGIGPGLSSYACEDCGVILARNEGDPPPYCPICRAKGDTFSESKHHQRVIFPAGVIPFTVSEQEARSLLAGLLTNRFLPDELLRLRDKGEIQPLYVPVFIYDALTRSTWRVESGFRTVEMLGDRPVERSVWEPTGGYYEHFFEDFAVPIVQAVLEFGEIYDDYDLGSVVPYDPRFLRGFNTELYQFDEMDTFQMADQMMSGLIREAAEGRALGDEQRKLEVKSEKFALAFRHILVPLWIGVFTYEDETYTYLINGQTGAISGSNPLSTRKILVATGAFALLVVLLGLALG
jgi:uncharacterized Zn finger protein (UPF0148 family)